MNNEGNGGRGGIGFLGLLGIVFIVLKLCHVIDWPWIWVLAPLWGGVILSIIIIIIFAIIIKIKTSRKEK